MDKGASWWINLDATSSSSLEQVFGCPRSYSSVCLPSFCLPFFPKHVVRAKGVVMLVPSLHEEAALD